MHNQHTPKRPDGFAKYRARHYRDARHSLLLLPPAKRRALRRNVIFIGLALGAVLLIAVISKASAAGGTYVIDDGDKRHRLTWGTGLEYQAHAVTLITKRYGQAAGDQAWQAGPRFHVGECIDVDLVVGRSLGATLRF